ncbi:hypothetical protein DDE18_16315 [Nocardioides gansuensis]|uniref:Uncharacterized protein n=1 Tax=Nocardioides gansuensis TaxID=2138300 RepID=A0A2T8F788_9ACTN|nr:hypothetical protein [Nocardioides gansuensis]PVG81573.1 hypothetical protein DDE18_16315 [Nocardioides gansuensis]
MSTRVYVPLSLDVLRESLSTGAMPAGAERVVAADAEEESEYLALMTAADLSAELLGGAGRRVVVVAEVADPEGEIALTDVVAVHADAEPFTDPDEDLAWYAAQELPALVAQD